MMLYLPFALLVSSEITIRLKDGKELTIYGSSSIPTNIPVISWCPLMLKGEPRSSDIPYVQLEELRDGASIDDKITQLRRQKKVKALILLSEKKKFNEDLIPLEGRSFVVIFAPPNAKQDLKPFLAKSPSRTISVIPMLKSGEVHLNYVYH